jgi:Spy/CpxP family protein refolding chaperone
VQTAADALHTTLADKNATAADIQAKVDALRAARAKAKADLAEAQADIQKVLTPKQVAALVELGLLE